MTSVEIRLDGDAGMNKALEEGGLSMEVLHMENEDERDAGCARIWEAVKSAYGKEPEAWFFKYYDRIVMLVDNKSGEVVAASAVHLTVVDDDSVEFKTRFEAVDKTLQRNGFGSLLFTCVERFAVRYIVKEGYIKGRIMSFVDQDQLDIGHGAFMLKNGFEREEDEDEADDEGLAFVKTLKIG